MTAKNQLRIFSTICLIGAIFLTWYWLKIAWYKSFILYFLYGINIGIGIEIKELNQKEKVKLNTHFLYQGLKKKGPIKE